MNRESTVIRPPPAVNAIVYARRSLRIHVTCVSGGVSRIELRLHSLSEKPLEAGRRRTTNGNESRQSLVALCPAQFNIPGATSYNRCMNTLMPFSLRQIPNDRF
jgi:hypothetical protein